ncbi:hypothetical protein ACWEEL_26390, partial [Streptomyces sp. NPDC005009]
MDSGRPLHPARERDSLESAPAGTDVRPYAHAGAGLRRPRSGAPPAAHYAPARERDSLESAPAGTDVHPYAHAGAGLRRPRSGA